MRTKNLFRTLAAVGLAVISTSMFGQATSVTATAPTAGPETAPAYNDNDYTDTVGGAATDYTEYYDYVTVGSKMPYVVRKDANIDLMIASGLYTPSVFKINVYDGTAWGADWDETSFAITDNAGGALSLQPNTAYTVAAQEAFPYTLDSSYVIYWKDKGAINAITDRVIMMQEWPVSNTAGMVTCPGINSTLTVKVVDKPIVDWDDDLAAANGPWVNSSCGGNIVVNVDYQGFGSVKVAYDSTAYNLAGTQTSTGRDTTTFTQLFGVPSLQNAQRLTNWNPGATYGYVDYTIVFVNDLISRKSLTTAAGGTFLSVAGGTHTGITAGMDPTFANNTEAGANMPFHKYRIYSLPVPSARPIKHVQNTGW
jgi:hypothetical protein